jgi:hypothetical protein
MMYKVATAMATEFEDTLKTPDLLSDCRVMLGFARKSGLALSPQLQRQIADLDAMLAAAQLPPITSIPPALVAMRTPAPIDETADPQEPAEALTGSELILRVHQQLSDVIAPATAISVQSSEPPPGRSRFLGGMPLVVKAALLAALISAIGFVVSAAAIAGEAAASKPANSGAASTPLPGQTVIKP